MLVRSVISLLLAGLVAAGASSSAIAPDRRVLIIGDSVGTGMLWHDSAIAVVQQNLAVEWQIAVCRTVEGQSCPFDGDRAPTLVELVHARTSLPPVVVVELGYNDPAPTFAGSVDDAMTAMVAAGAKHVLWLTLRAARQPYPTLNTVLRQALTRWPQLELVDWDGVSAGHNDWFQNDDVHLLESGGIAMAHLVHAAVMRLVDPLRVAAPTLRLRDGRAYSLRLAAAGGAAPYRWRVAQGRPPRGFHLLANGQLSARLARGVRATVRLAVTDADGSTATLQVLAGSP